jgi:uncharacterized protein
VTFVDNDRRNPPPGFKPDYITAPPLEEKQWEVRSLAIDLSGTCNMRCRYCAEAVTMPQRRLMSEDTFDAAWRFLFPNGIEAAIAEPDTRKKSYSIHMGSGEPLLNFPLMKKLRERVDQARSEGLNNFHVHITTNAVLLDKEIMDWLIDSGWVVKISIDGPPAIHDKWRVLPGDKGTYEQAAGVLTYLAEKIPDRLVACAVLCRGNDPGEVFTHLESMGAKRIDLLPVAHSDESIIPGPEDIENYKKFIMDYAARYLGDEDKKPGALVNHFCFCMMRLMGYNKARLVCSAGRYYLGVDPEGDIYPCGRLLGIDEYRLGTITGGLEPDARKAFLKDAGRPYDRREPCSYCWAAPLCCGPCFACAEMFGPGKGNPVEYQCAYMIADAQAAVFLYNQLKDDNPEALFEFLPGVIDQVFD